MVVEWSVIFEIIFSSFWSRVFIKMWSIQNWNWNKERYLIIRANNNILNLKLISQNVSKKIALIYNIFERQISYPALSALKVHKKKNCPHQFTTENPKQMTQFSTHRGRFSPKLTLCPVWGLGTNWRFNDALVFI